MHSLKLAKILCIDEALYAKATEIAWKHYDKLKIIIIRMGGFHGICNLILIIELIIGKIQD